MPGIPQPRLIPVPPSLIDISGPTYSQIFDETMTNLGTPSDGFDAMMNEALTLTANAFLDEADFANDLSAMSGIADTFGQAIEGDLGAALQPASDATDASFAAYGILVPPPANPTGSINPAGGGVATGGPGAACTVPQGVTPTTLTAMDTSQPPLDIFIAGGQFSSKFDNTPGVLIICGDGSIFSIAQVQTLIGTGGEEGPVYQLNFYLRVTPANARVNPRINSTFTVQVEVRPNRSTGLPTYDKYFQVGIYYSSRP